MTANFICGLFQTGIGWSSSLSLGQGFPDTECCGHLGFTPICLSPIY